MEILKTLSDTPLPTILVIAGILFLLLSVAGGVSGKIQVPEKRQRTAGWLGSLLLLGGLGLYLYSSQDVQGSNSNASIPTQADTLEIPDTLDFDTLGNALPFMEWPLISSEAFDSDNKKWNTGSVAIGQVSGDRSILLGKYRWNITFGSPSWYRVLSPYGTTVDHYVATDLRIISLSEGKQLSAGLVFNASEKSGYRLYINSTNYIKLVLRNNDKYTTLINWTRIPDIDLTSFNRFGVWVQSSLIKIFINDILSLEINDSSLRSGNVGLICRSYTDNTKGIIEFDNFEYRRKPGI